MKHTLFIVVLAAVVFSIAACSRIPDTLTLSGPTMGTSYTVKVVATATTPEPGRLQVAIDARLNTLNERLSTYIDTSEVSRFNARASTDWFEVSPDTVTIVETGQRISDLSRGAFDITVGPLVNLWGFGPDGQPSRIPAQNDIDALMQTTGYQMLEVRASPPALRKTLPGLWIDLSAIAKGYAVDEIAVLLDDAGVTNYMVEIGGEIRTRGHRADGANWRIALENPIAGTRTVLRVVGLRENSIATSGDYRNFFEHDGKRYSHTIDPNTGWPVAHTLGAVSVIGESAMTADAWATALMVLGPQQGMQVATDNDIAALFIVRQDDELVESMTPAFETYLEQVAASRRQ